MNLNNSDFINKIEGVDFSSGYRVINENSHYFFENFLKKNNSTNLVIIIHHHGYCDFASMNDFLAEEVFNTFQNSGKDILVASFDNKGHGHSSGQRLTIENFNDYVDSKITHINDIYDTFKDKYDNIDLILSGHSMGGFIITNVVKKIKEEGKLNNNIKGLFLLSPYFFLNVDKPITAFILDKLVKVPFIGNKLGNLVIPTGGKTEEICNDLDFTKILDNLYLYGKNYFTINWVTQMRNNQVDFMSSIDSFVSGWDTPTYILMADNEQLVSNDYSQKFFEKIPSNYKLGCELAEDTMHKIFFSSGRKEAVQKYCEKMLNLLK